MKKLCLKFSVFMLKKNRVRKIKDKQTNIVNILYDFMHIAFFLLTKQRSVSIVITTTENPRKNNNKFG